MRLTISIIIPCRNEERYIGSCLDSILSNGFDSNRLEIVVVDGMSDDRTRTIVKQYTDQNPNIKMLDNLKKATPVALNLGIINSTGDVIFRVDAHARLEKGYISECIKYLYAWNTDNVGGIMKTLSQNDSRMGKAIAIALSHPFGVWNSYFRIHSNKTKWVDTVFGGCYRRDVFQRIGFFNENLIRGQDLEFNLRLKKYGGRTLLVPDIISYYYARSDLKSFWEHNWTNGEWAILPFLYSTIMPVSWRHLVPLFFVIGLLMSIIFALISFKLIWIFILLFGTYGLMNLAVSLLIFIKEKNIFYLVLMPLSFVSLHIAYGLGSLYGLVKALSIFFFRFS